MFTLSDYLLSSNEDSINLGLHLLLYQDESILDDFKKFAIGNRSKASSICYNLIRMELGASVKDRIDKVLDILHDFGEVSNNVLLSVKTSYTTIFDTYSLVDCYSDDLENAIIIGEIAIAFRNILSYVYNRNRDASKMLMNRIFYKDKILAKPFIFANDVRLITFSGSVSEDTALAILPAIVGLHYDTEPSYCKIVSEESISSKKIADIFSILNNGCALGDKVFKITKPYNHDVDAITTSKF